ncbi:MAG: 16S rRNA processing protein RimM [Sebaldella sp.]|nr:16S rRNA processing protein RimM [Sebaldella sp.]
MELVNIGTVVGTHHLNGAVKVSSVFQDIDLIMEEKVLLEKKEEKKLFTIKSIKRINAKKLLIEFIESKDIDTAKSLNGFQIKIRRDLLPEKNGDDFYYNDLLGLKVTEDGIYLGSVLDVLETAAHDILIVMSDNSEEILIPIVDNFVKKIDFENNNIEVELIEGMK